MLSHLASRLFTLLLVLLLIFLLIHLVPGDPIESLLGDHATSTDREALRTALGLNLPLHTQFINFLSGLVTGNWGTSLASGKPVLSLIAERAPATVYLALAAMSIAVAIGLWGGIATATVRHQFQSSYDSLLLALIATPTFCLGPLLMLIFAVKLGWFPVSGMGQGFSALPSLILPALTLGIGLGAHLARLTAASLTETLATDYHRTARAKGATPRRALYKHALRNALVPVIIIFCLQLGMVLTGTVLTEAVFGWPGLGNLLVEALHSRDYPVVQGCLLLISLTYMAAVVLGDTLAALLDPRLRRIN